MSDSDKVDPKYFTIHHVTIELMTNNNIHVPEEVAKYLATLFSEHFREDDGEGLLSSEIKSVSLVTYKEFLNKIKLEHAEAGKFECMN